MIGEVVRDLPVRVLARQASPSQEDILVLIVSCHIGFIRQWLILPAWQPESPHFLSTIRRRQRLLQTAYRRHLSASPVSRPGRSELSHGRAVVKRITLFAVTIRS
jgi:hypothetical protein